MIDDTEKFIERFRYKATKAVQVQSKIKQLDKLERLEVDEEDNSSINVRFASAPRSGSVVIEAENLSKSFGSHVVLDNIRLTIERGEKIAFVGRNGEGKTTLSRIIIGELDSTGLLKKGHNVRTGYFAQNQDELLDENLTVFETIDETARGEIRTKLRDLLGAFLFRGDDADKKVSVLSGGERSRLAIIKLLLEPYNLLVLDEPTNHLDIRSKDILKEALIRYDGTLIVVSHDRDFLNNLVDKVYEFRHRKVRQYIGGIYDFLRKKKIESLRDLELKQKSISEQPGDKNKSANRIRYEEKKEFERTIRKLKKRIEDLETDIEKTERELEVMGDKFTEPLDEEGSYVEMYRMYKELKSDLNEKMNRWTEYTHELEMMLKNNQ
jgi:ATP-binding cassette subfamily F protein 3